MRYIPCWIIVAAITLLSSCRVNNSSTDGEDNKLAEIIEEYPYLSKDYVAYPVDLGLSVKWASHNLGAILEDDEGYLFRYGSTIPSPKKDNSPYDFNTKRDYSIAGEPEFDPATKYWGAEWRMPTYEQFEELRQNCKWEYYKEAAGYLITGPNGATIYFPVTTPWYWTATTYKSGAPLCFLLNGYNNIHLDIYNSPRNAHLIRPVYIE